MKSFKLLKREFLIRLMTVLGFGGMVGFCIPSCQQAKPNQDNQVNQESVNDNSADSVQTVAESEKPVVEQAVQNDDKQPEQKSNNNSDSIQTATDSDAPDDNSAEPILVDLRQENNQVQKRHIASAYGILYPNPQKVRMELSALNQKIQSTCHPEAGTLSVTFYLNSYGQLKNIKVKDGTLKDTKSETCILKELSKYKVSAKNDCKGCSNKYDFNFSFK